MAYFGGNVTTDSLRTIVTAMANIRELHLPSGRVVDGFLLPDPDELDVNGKLFPSLRRLRLEGLYEDNIKLLAVRRSRSLSRGMPSHP